MDSSLDTILSEGELGTGGGSGRSWEGSAGAGGRDWSTGSLMALGDPPDGESPAPGALARALKEEEACDTRGAVPALPAGQMLVRAHMSGVEILGQGQAA